MTLPPIINVVVDGTSIAPNVTVTPEVTTVAVNTLFSSQYADRATSASYAEFAATTSVSSVQYQDLLNKPTLVSASSQVNTGSFLGTFIGTASVAGISSISISSSFSSLATTASFAISSAYAPQASVNFSTGSYTGSFVGDGSQLVNVTGSYVDFGNITNLPTLVSSSLQIATASFATSASYTVTASAATSITFVPNAAVTASYVNYSNVVNKPPLISSSAQINTGSFSGTLIGTASFSTTASAATSITFIPVTSSFATTASAATSITFVPNTTNTASYVDFVNIANKPTLVSASSQINTGSFSGNLQGSASYASTASIATGLSFIPASASYATTASAATSITFIPTTSSFATTASYAQNAGVTNFSTGSYTGSFVGTHTGSLSGTASYSTTASAATSITFVPTTASFATTASAATSITFVPASASYALTASIANVATTANAITFVPATASFASKAAILMAGTQTITGSLLVSGTIDNTGYSHTASFFKGDGSQITGVVSASYAPNLPDDWSTILNKPVGLVSSSLQINSGSYSGSFIGTASYATTASYVASVVSASYAQTASAATSITFIPLTASYALNAGATGGGLVGAGTSGKVTVWAGTALSSSIIDDNGNRINIPFPLTASFFKGDGTQITGVVSASYAIVAGTANAISFTPALATTASYVASASYSTTASAATSITFIPALATTASYVSSASYAITASAATSITFVPILATTASYVANAASASYAVTASTATSITFVPVTASFATKAASLMAGTQTITGSLLVSGTIDNTGYSHTASFFKGDGSQITGVISASYAPNLPDDWSTILNKPVGLVSSSVQVNSGSFSGSFIGTASYATTASAATSITFIPLTASYALNAGATGGGLVGAGTSGKVAVWAGTALSSSIIDDNGSRINIPFPVTASFFKGDGTQITGVVTSSFATTASAINFTPASASFAITASAATSITFIPALATTASYVASVVSASYALSASWAPGGGSSVSASFATTASAATSITFIPASASYATTAATASYFTGSLDFPNGLIVTGSVSASSFQGNGAQVTGVISSSYALSASAATSITFIPLTASYALNAGATGGGLTGAGTSGKVAVWSGTSISSSIIDDNGSRINIPFPLTASFFKGDGTQITGVVSSSYALSASWSPSIPVISSSYALSASYAPNIPDDWSIITNIPVGLVSSSAQYSTGSYTGSFTGSVAGSASYAKTSWNDIFNVPVHIVSSSGQFFNSSFTGFFTGSFSGSLVGSASYATTASAATSITFVPVLATTASYVASVVSSSYATTSSAATSITFIPSTASFATTASYAQNAGVTNFSTGSYTGSFVGDYVATTQATLPFGANIANSLYTTINTLVNSGSTPIALIPTNSYNAVFFDYCIGSGSNFRAGTVIAGWLTATPQYTEYSTTDSGDTSFVSMSMDIVSGNARLNIATVTNGWGVKSIVRAI